MCGKLGSIGKAHKSNNILSIPYVCSAPTYVNPSDSLGSMKLHPKKTYQRYQYKLAITLAYKLIFLVDKVL